MELWAWPELLHGDWRSVRRLNLVLTDSYLEIYTITIMELSLIVDFDHFLEKERRHPESPAFR